MLGYSYLSGANKLEPSTRTLIIHNNIFAWGGTYTLIKKMI